MKSSKPASSVGYTVGVNGAIYQLATPAVVANGDGQTGLGGTANTVTITVGSTEKSLAGSYSDSITVTATTSE